MRTRVLSKLFYCCNCELMFDGEILFRSSPGTDCTPSFRCYVIVIGKIGDDKIEPYRDNSTEMCGNVWTRVIQLAGQMTHNGLS